MSPYRERTRKRARLEEQAAQHRGAERLVVWVNVAVLTMLAAAYALIFASAFAGRVVLTAVAVVFATSAAGAVWLSVVAARALRRLG